MNKRDLERGAVNSLVLSTVILAAIAVAAIIVAIWGVTNYNAQKKDVDTRIQSAVATAQKSQADADAANFNEREKQPYSLFAGPDDYGHLTFDYPKTWSVYVAQDVINAGDTFQAYLNPVSVPPVDNNSDSQQFALRVTIQNVDFDTTLASYNSLVQAGSLKSSTVTINGTTGTRLDGNFNDNIRGSAILFKIRDETVTIRTDANTFDKDFNALIKTIKFNP